MEEQYRHRPRPQRQRSRGSVERKKCNILLRSEVLYLETLDQYCVTDTNHDLRPTSSLQPSDFVKGYLLQKQSLEGLAIEWQFSESTLLDAFQQVEFHGWGCYQFRSFIGYWLFLLLLLWVTYLDRLANKQ